MFENRFREYFESNEPAPVLTPSGFMPCPVPLLANFGVFQQSFVAEVYRRAQELTESQMRKPVRRLIPEFSRN